MRIEGPNEPKVIVEVDPTLKTFSCLGKTCLSQDSLKYSGVAVEVYSQPVSEISPPPQITPATALAMPTIKDTVDRSDAILRRQHEILSSIVASPFSFIQRTAARSLQISGRMSSVLSRARAFLFTSFNTKQ
jgi:hypothetical protein